MEELLQYMNSFRSQVNDVADQAAKISVEQHLQSSMIQSLEKDLDSVKNETRRVKEDTDSMAKVKGQICSQIIEKQRKFALLESDSSTLNQTLKLMQQEKLTLSTKLAEKSAYYKEVEEGIIKELQEKQEWANSQSISPHIPIGSISEKACGTEELQEDKKNESLIIDIQAAIAKLDQISQSRSNLVFENTKLKESIEQVKTRIVNFKPELRGMDEKSLNDELQALLSDKDGETEYVQSLQLQITKLKEISQTVKCPCGNEYNVELDNCT